MRRSRYAVLAVWLAALIGCLTIIFRTPFVADLSAFLPRSPSPSEEALVEQLRDGAVSRVILVGIEGAPAPVLTSLSKALAKRLRSAPAFVSVTNGDDSRLAQDQAFLWENRYLLSSAVTPERFSEAGLKQALQSDIELLGSPASALVKSYVPKDPTGEMLHLFDEAMPASAPSSADGVWVSADGKTALLILQTAAPMSDVDAQEANLARIGGAFAASQQETENAAAARLVATGPAVFSVATRDRIKGDAMRFSTFATLLVASILLLVYRSPRLLFFGLLPVASGAIAGIAAVSLAYGFVHGITLGFGVTLIGEAVDYPIYLFTQTIPGTRPRDTLARIWPTLRLGVLTSVFGFSALLFSSFEGLAQLGVFSIAGLMTAVSVTRWVVPLLLPADFQIRRPVAVGAGLQKVVQSAPGLRWLALAVVAGACVFLVLQRGNLWDDELASLSPIPIADKEADQNLRAQLGAPDAGFLLLVNGATEEAALESSERAADELQRLVSQHLLAGFQSPVAFLPSQTTQKRRQDAIPPRAELAARLERAAIGMPFRPGTFAPFLEDAESAKTRALIGRKSLAGTSFGLLADTLLIQHGERWQAVFPLRGVMAPDKIAEAIAQAGIPGTIFLDIKRDSDAFYAAYRQQAVLLSLGGVLAILLLLGASLRSLRRVAAVAIPLAAAVLAASAILVMSGQRLTIFHLIGLLLTVAAGSNYSLFFERDHAAGEAHEWVVASLALANLCTVIGFGILSFSQIPVLHGIGMTVACGTVLSLVFSAILSKTINGDDAAMTAALKR